MPDGTTSSENLEVSKNPETQQRVEKRTEGLAKLNRYKDSPQSDLHSKARSQIAAEIWINRVRQKLGIKVQTAEEKAKAAELNSKIDIKTGLPNDRWLTERIEQALSESKGTGKPFWLLFTDFDDFKAYNGRFGHPGGDKILRLMRAPRTRIGEEVARYGGDEFVQLLNSDIDLAQAASVAGRNADAIEEAGRRLLPTLHVSDTTVYQPERVTVSMGLIESRPHMNATDLLQIGSETMKSAKKTGKDAIVVAPSIGETYQINRVGETVNG